MSVPVSSLSLSLSLSLSDKLLRPLVFAHAEEVSGTQYLPEPISGAQFSESRDGGTSGICLCGAVTFAHRFVSFVLFHKKTLKGGCRADLEMSSFNQVLAL